MKVGMLPRISSLLGLAATYGCIFLIMDFGNSYARVFSWSAQSDASWQISSILFVALAATALVCDYIARPWGWRRAAKVQARVTPSR